MVVTFLVMRKFEMPWNLLISLLQKAQFNHILETLQAGLSEEELENYEKQNNVQLPVDVRLSYRVYNGQIFSNRRTVGIFGGYQFL